MRPPFHNREAAEVRGPERSRGDLTDTTTDAGNSAIADDHVGFIVSRLRRYVTKVLIEGERLTRRNHDPVKLRGAKLDVAIAGG